MCYCCICPAAVNIIISVADACLSVWVSGEPATKNFKWELCSSVTLLWEWSEQSYHLKKTAALHPVIFFKGMNCSVAISSAVECSESVVCVLWNSSVKLTQGNKQNFSRCMLHSYKYWSVKSCKRRQIKIIIRTGTHWENALLSYHWCTWYSNRVLWIALPAMWSQKCFNKSHFFFFIPVKNWKALLSENGSFCFLVPV